MRQSLRTRAERCFLGYNRPPRAKIEYITHHSRDNRGNRGIVGVVGIGHLLDAFERMGEEEAAGVYCHQLLVTGSRLLLALLRILRNIKKECT